MAAKPAVLHLRFFTQVGSTLRPHLISFLQPTTTAHRERNFSLYIYVLEALAPCFCSWPHETAHWLPVHIMDMKALPLELRDEFKNLSVHKDEKKVLEHALTKHTSKTTKPLKRHGPFMTFYFYCKIMLISIRYNYCSVLTANKCFVKTELTS